MPTMQQLMPGQANPEVVVNENFVSLEHQAVYAMNPDTTAALSWGYLGGRWGGFSVSAGVLTLSDDATNHIVASRDTGAVSVSASATNWDNPAAYARLYKVTTASGAVTAVEDHRAGFAGAHGHMPPPQAATVASASTLTLPLGASVVTVTGTTGITNITATGRSGQVVTLIFQGALTVTDGGNLRLAGNFTTTADDTLTLACNGTNWYECSRSAN